MILLPDVVWEPLLSFEQVTEQATAHMYSPSYYLMMCYYFEEEGEGDGDGNATCRCRSIMVVLGTVGDGLPHVVYRLGGQHPPRPSPERPSNDASEHVHAATASPPPLKPARHQKRQIRAVPDVHKQEKKIVIHMVRMLLLRQYFQRNVMQHSFVHIVTLGIS